MNHPIHRLTDFDIVEPYTLQVAFDDGTTQSIDFQPLLAGELPTARHRLVQSCAH